ncbi:unannotated protein [freshwater metagenome]|uniref:Unannotated protein n=2 Tax=freshwater metagenome TaxID=449393 RepID=A0A6J7D2A9_9ZZZZ
MTGTQIDLTRYVKPGDTIIIGQGAGEPQALVQALIEQRHSLGGVRVYIGASYTGAFRPEHADAIEFISIGVVGRTAALADAGVLTIIPAHFGSLPMLMRRGVLRPDVVLAQMTPANAEGVHSLGAVCDYLSNAVEMSPCVLAEINPRVPFTIGDVLVPSSRIAGFVHNDVPLVPVERRTPSSEEDIIGRLVASVVPDGATIQFGIGTLPDAILSHLGDKKDLGVHSGLISDAVVDLVERGVITNARKEIDRGLTVAGSLLGTERLHEWVTGNPSVVMRNVEYTHNAGVLGRLGSLHAINSAIEIDLTGQISAEVVGGRHLGLVGGQGSFARAACFAEQGRSILALPSTAKSGATRIVHRFSDGIVSSGRSDADLIVTEHGIADLRGASLVERRQRLIAIAAPEHREQLRALATS